MANPVRGPEKPRVLVDEQDDEIPFGAEGRSESSLRVDSDPEIPFGTVDAVPFTDPMAGQLVRILIVDDDRKDFRLIESTLRRVERAFFEIDWARTYDAGLLWFERDEHAVYLVDLKLAGRDGIELIREARRQGCRKPIIAVSAAPDRILDLGAMKAGATDYLPKAEMRPALMERVIRYAVERQRAEQRLVWLSRYDRLTGLANRAQFRERLVRAVSRARGHDRRVALLALNIDRFRGVNERLGHEGADIVLCEVAHRIASTLGGQGLLARVGGDEFAAILEEIPDPEIAGTVAMDICERIARPMTVNGTALHVSVSIGISVFPHDAPSTETMFRNADEALVRAKRGGGGRIEFHSTDTTRRIVWRQALRDALVGALDRKEFLLHYQPLVTCVGQRPRAVEALLRWQTEDMRLVSPSEFIPVLASSGAISRVSEWILERATRDFARVMRHGPDDVRMIVNLSLEELVDPETLTRLARSLHRAGIPPDWLQLDISERLLIGAPKVLEARTRDLKAIGVSLSVDDFGTAGASLATLARYPFDTIKIAPQFVQNVAIDRRAAEVLGALIATGHGLGLEVHAEGVQTRGQLAVLQDRGCNGVQGYLFGGPMSADAVEAWLRRVKATE